MSLAAVVGADGVRSSVVTGELVAPLSYWIQRATPHGFVPSLSHLNGLARVLAAPCWKGASKKRGLRDIGRWNSARPCRERACIEVMDTSLMNRNRMIWVGVFSLTLFR